MTEKRISVEKVMDYFVGQVEENLSHYKDGLITPEELLSKLADLVLDPQLRSVCVRSTAVDWHNSKLHEGCEIYLLSHNLLRRP